MSTLKGRTRLRIEDSDVGKRPLSPLIRKPDYLESRISTEEDEYEIPVKKYPRRKRYRVPQVSVDDEDYDIPIRRHSRREESQELYHEGESSSSFKHDEPSQTRYTDKPDRRQGRYRMRGDEQGSKRISRGSVEKNDAPRGRAMFSRDDSFGSNSSCRSQQRRQERLHPDE